MRLKRTTPVVTDQRRSSDSTAHVVRAPRTNRTDGTLSFVEKELAALLAEDGCPVCRTVHGHERQYFFWFLLEGSKDSGVLDGFTRALGFCAMHAGYVLAQGHGRGRLAATHAIATRHMREVFALDRRRDAWEAEIVAAGGRPAPCPGCHAEAESARRTAFFLGKLIRREDGRDRYGAPGLACLPHLALLAPLLADPALDRLLARHDAALSEAVRRGETDRAETQASILRLAVGHAPSLDPWPPLFPAEPPVRPADPVAALAADMRGGHCPACMETFRAGAAWTAWLDHAACTGEAISDLLPTCPRHVWAVFRSAGPALATQLVAHMLGAAHNAIAFALRKFHEPLPKPDPKRPVEALTRLAQGRRPLIRVARGALARPPRCPVCDRLAIARDQTLRLVAAMLEQHRYRADYEAGHGLCLDHFARLIALRPEAKVREFLYQAQAAKLAVLGCALEEFSRKAAWQWRPEPVGAERLAPGQALARFSGAFDLAPARPPAAENSR